METEAKVTFDVGTAWKGEKADAMSRACLEVGVEGGRCEEGARGPGIGVTRLKEPALEKSFKKERDIAGEGAWVFGFPRMPGV